MSNYTCTQSYVPVIHDSLIVLVLHFVSLVPHIPVLFLDK